MSVARTFRRARLVCCADGAQTLERRSVKIRRSQPASRQRNRRSTGVALDSNIFLETANTGYGVSARWIGNQDRQQSPDRELLDATVVDLATREASQCSNRRRGLREITDLSSIPASVSQESRLHQSCVRTLIALNSWTISP